MTGDLERLVAACSATPEQAERFRQSLDDLTRDLAAGLARVIETLGPALRAAGVLPSPVPEDPRERALQARQSRGTGPDRQVQHRPRPRRHP